MDLQREGRITRPRLAWLASDAFLLALVLCVAVFFRVWRLAQAPPGLYFDEAFESLQARRILTEPGYHPIFFADNNGVPPANIYLTALAFLIGGERTLSIRYVAAVAGALTVPAVYLLAREFFGSEEGREGAGRYLPVAAALILAVLPWHTNLSRQGVEVVLLPLWATLAVLALWRGLKTRRAWFFVLSGFFWGTCPYTYQAAAFLPGVLLLFLVYKVVQERGFLRRYAAGLVVLCSVALVCLLPLAAFAYEHPEVITQRAQQVTLPGSGTAGQALAQNVVKVLGVFVTNGDPNLADNLPDRPVLPTLLLPIFAAGILIALRRGRRAEYALCLIWFAWMLVPSMLTDRAPSLRRSIGATPPLALLTAGGLIWTLDAIRDRVAPHLTRRVGVSALGGLAVCGMLAFTAAWGYQYYFVDWAGKQALYHEFDAGLVNLGQYADEAAPGTRLYFSPAAQGDVLHLPLTWAVRDRDLHSFDGHWGLVLAPPRQGSLYLLRTFLDDAPTLADLQQFYPTGKVTHLETDLSGATYGVAFAVDAGTSPAVAPQIRLDVNFGGQIELLGAAFSQTVVRPGDTLTVTLLSRPIAGPTQAGHTVFVHLLGPPDPAGQSRLWAGHDSPPLHNSYPTTQWAEGEIVVDRHPFTIPADAPAGIYRIETGLYTPENASTRLRILGPAGETGADSVVIGQITVQDAGINP